MKWIKSSRSGGSSGGANCVEMARTPDRVYVRDSKLGEASPILDVSPDAWRAFVESVR